MLLSSPLPAYAHPGQQSGAPSKLDPRTLSSDPQPLSHSNSLLAQLGLAPLLHVHCLFDSLSLVSPAGLAYTDSPVHTHTLRLPQKPTLCQPHLTQSGGCTSRGSLHSFGLTGAVRISLKVWGPRAHECSGGVLERTPKENSNMHIKIAFTGLCVS